MPYPRLLAVLVSVLGFSGTLAHAQTSLSQHGSAPQLLVDGQPFLMRGVETTNKLLDDPSDLPHLDENLAMYKSAEYFQLSRLDASYPALAGLTPLILEKQGREPREMVAFLVGRDDRPDEIYEHALKGWKLTARSLVGVPTPEEDLQMVTPFACVFWMKESEFLVVGTKMTVTVAHDDGSDVTPRDASYGVYLEDHWEAEGPAVCSEDGPRVELRLSTEHLAIEQIWLQLEPK